MKLSDYVADFLARKGIKHVFGFTGGSVVHLFDSLYRNPNIDVVFTQHEQVASYAANAYAKIKGTGVCMVTTGPGGTNAVTGLSSAWLDSIPSMFISGQTRLEHTTRDKPVRQIGTQALDIISVVEPISKYAIMVDDANNIRYYLEKAMYEMHNGRPGPVWIDIPLEIQWEEIDENKLKGFTPVRNDYEISGNDIDQCVGLIKNAKKPVIIAGHGIKSAGASDLFKELIDKTNIPYVTTWNTFDIYDSDLHIGCMGNSSNESTKAIIRDCDLLIAIGSHLSLPLISNNYKEILKDTKIIVADIDKDELDYLLVDADVSVLGDAKDFMSAITDKLVVDVKDWTSKCNKYRTKMSKKYIKGKQVDPHYFLDKLSDKLNADDCIVIDGGGTIIYMSFKSLKPKNGQHIMIEAGLAPMGSGLPNAIGASFATNKKRVICLCGDGSMQLNIQDLQTIYYNKLPIKIFIINNKGYLAIRHTQNGWLDKRYVGSAESGGLSLPDFERIVKAYRIKYVKAENDSDVDDILDSVLNSNEPVVCELFIPENQSADGGFV